jgi:hypothetical protein
MCGGAGGAGGGGTGVPSTTSRGFAPTAAGNAAAAAAAAAGAQGGGQGSIGGVSGASGSGGAPGWLTSPAAAVRTPNQQAAIAKNIAAAVENIPSSTTVSASNAATARRRTQTRLTGRRSLLGDPNLGQQSLLG